LLIFNQCCPKITKDLTGFRNLSGPKLLIFIVPILMPVKSTILVVAKKEELPKKQLLWCNIDAISALSMYLNLPSYNIQ